MNKITQSERDHLVTRVTELIQQHGRQRAIVINQLIQETGISKERAKRAYSKVILKLNRP